MPREIPNPITFSMNDSDFHSYVDYEMPFGKHKGKAMWWIWQNDNAYFQWLGRQTNLNGKLLRAVKHHIQTDLDFAKQEISSYHE